MASALFISNAFAQAQATAVNVATTGFGGAVMTIYSNSTTKPTNANTALSGSAVTLATITLPAYTANTVTNGVITFGAITSVTGANTGVASYYRIVASNTTTVLCDGNVGLTGDTPDLVLDNTTITSGASVAITSFTYTVTQ